MKIGNFSVEAKLFEGFSDFTRLSILITLINGEKFLNKYAMNMPSGEAKVL